MMIARIFLFFLLAEPDQLVTGLFTGDPIKTGIWALARK